MTQTSRILLVHLNTGTTHTGGDNTISSRLSKSPSSSSSSSSFDGQEDDSMIGAERVGARTYLGSNEDASYGEICTSTEVPQWGIHTGQVNFNLPIMLLISLLPLPILSLSFFTLLLHTLSNTHTLLPPYPHLHSLFFHTLLPLSSPPSFLLFLTLRSSPLIPPPPPPLSAPISHSHSPLYRS